MYITFHCLLGLHYHTDKDKAALAYGPRGRVAYMGLNGPSECHHSELGVKQCSEWNEQKIFFVATTCDILWYISHK